MLKNYFAPEDLKIRCDACKSNEQRERTGVLEHLPEVFTFQFQVFSEDFDRGVMVKDNRRASFPASLRVADYAAPGLERTDYTLAAAVYHSGDLRNGHYVARVLGLDKKIYHLDDEERPLPVASWVGALKDFTPYLLFYVRD